MPGSLQRKDTDRVVPLHKLHNKGLVYPGICPGGAFQGPDGSRDRGGIDFERDYLPGAVKRVGDFTPGEIPGFLIAKYTNLEIKGEAIPGKLAIPRFIEKRGSSI